MLFSKKYFILLFPKVTVEFGESKKENLMDNMTNLELVLNMLTEATTTEISKEKKPKTFNENKEIAIQGGTLIGNTRKEIEEKTWTGVVSSLNAKSLEHNKDGSLDTLDKN